MRGYRSLSAIDTSYVMGSDFSQSVSKCYAGSIASETCIFEAMTFPGLHSLGQPSREVLRYLRLLRGSRKSCRSRHRYSAGPLFL